MIYSSIDSWKKNKERYPAAVNHAIEYALELFEDNAEPGKYSTENVPVLNLKEVAARPLSVCIPESHIRFSDLQIYKTGEEEIRVSELGESSKCTDEYNPDTDNAFYLPGCESVIHMHGGEFILLYPEDIHRACGNYSENDPLIKAVVKIETRLLT